MCVAAPPQHGKTELALRAYLWWDIKSPGLKHAYATYSATRSQEMAKEMQRLMDDAGIKWTGNLDVLHLPNGSRIKFTSIEGALTGYALTGVLVIDDPIKDAIDARSSVKRKKAVDWYKSVARSRRHPGTSFVVMATRWHTEDLSGYLIANEKYTYINLKAIAEPASVDDIDSAGRIVSDPLHRKPGESLWDRKPPEFFTEERTDAYWWAAMYQGEPRPAGGVVFAEPGSQDADGNPTGPRWYTELPNVHAGAFGIDLAYTAKTRSDFSILVEGVSDGDNLYITDVIRKQVDAPSFAMVLRRKQEDHPGWPTRWYIGGTEKPAVQFMAKQGIRIKAIPAVADKLVRATPVSSAWNRGRVLLPEKAKWLGDFLEIVCGFTGQGDAHDDDVDALAALHDQLMKKSRMVAALGKKQNG